VAAMLYELLKRCVSLFFNMLNRLLGGKLPPFGSAAVVVEQEGRYLIVELPGKRFVFPGGFMHGNELPQEAAEREGLEETGLILRAGDLIGYYSIISQDWKVMNNISFVFQAQLVGGELRQNIEGNPCWLSEQEVRERMEEHGLNILNDYLHWRDRQRKITKVAISAVS
jgi:ADP-ribose pyrophosphatase YjhB (NUDIX family)